MEKILILEDNYQLLKLISTLLTDESYQVFKGDSLKRGRDLLVKHKFDLLILDRVLRDGDSLDLLKDINKKDPHQRVLVFSKKRLVEDRIETLNLADDFLAKPFTSQEFLLKVKNILKRSKGVKLPVLKLADNSFLNYGVISDSKKTILRKKERQILECLLQYSPSIVSYELITSYVWGFTENHPSRKTVNVYIRRIRMKLGDLSKRLETIRGQGYRFLN